MESRFFRFGRAKRSTPTAPAPPTGLQSVPYDSTVSQGNDPIFIHQPLGKSIREVKRLEEQGLLLKGVAYDAMPEGKAPQFGHTPQKGNGPVKLQTSRRLSTGELMATTQDSQSLLEDIREGEYIIGGKDRREQHSPSPSPHQRQSLATTGTVGPSLRSRPSTSRSVVTSGTSTWSPGPMTPTSPMPSSPFDKTTLTSGLGISSPWLNSPSSQDETWVSNSPELPAKSLRPKPRERPSAIMAALKKAGNGRLSQLYGRDTVLQYGSSPPLSGSTHFPPSPASTRLSMVPEPAHRPSLDTRESKRSSHASGRSSVYSTDTSDALSENRESSSASWAASSASTTQTSLEEAESTLARENIRKMIESMRSNYLQAIESQAPATPSIKSTKKRRKSRLSASPSLEESHAKADRKTWHGHDAAVSAPVDTRPKSRHASHPVHAYGRLSPIEASPPRNDASSSDKLSPELRRADSMTLGNLMSQIPEAPKESAAAGGEFSAASDRPTTPAQTGHSELLKSKVPGISVTTLGSNAESSDSETDQSTTALVYTTSDKKDMSDRTPLPNPSLVIKSAAPASLAEMVAFI